MSEPFDPMQALSSQRRVMISGPLDATAMAAAAASLMFLDGSSAEPVTIVINSPGGPVQDSLGLFDTLSVMRTPLIVDVLGRAHGSAGALTAAAPGTRRIGASASISLHLDADTSAPPMPASDLAIFAAEHQHSRLALATAVSQRSGQTVEWVTENFDRGTVFGPSEAIELSLVDEIR